MCQTCDAWSEVSGEIGVVGAGSAAVSMAAAATSTMGSGVPVMPFEATASDTAVADTMAAGSAIAVTTNKTGDPYIDGVLYGIGNAVKWTGTVEYSFPSSVWAFDSIPATPTIFDYFSIGGFAQVSGAQASAVRSILGGSSFFDGDAPNASKYGSVESFTKLDLNEPVGANTPADIQIAQANTFNGANLDTARVADFPRPQDQRADGGDVWFGDDNVSNPSLSYRNPIIDNFAWHTHIHELGHALGLKHTHNNGGGDAPVPANRDSMDFSVMSYRSYINDPLQFGYSNEEFGYAQTWMMLDIAALQHLYGADFGTNKTNSTYMWDPNTGEMSINGVDQGAPGANRVFLTIWDGNGKDTYDMSNYDNGVTIDLQPGRWSKTSPEQRADLGDGNKAKGNVYNAMQYKGDDRSLIENAKGGKGKDTITGNDANNKLYGGNHNDTIKGLDGNDTLLGQNNNDRMWGGDNNDTMKGGNGNDILNGGRGRDKMWGNADDDTFDFNSTKDSVKGSKRDQIQDFNRSDDMIDVSGIDAKSGSGNQKFNWIGKSDFRDKKGELRYEDKGSTVIVQGDVNGDGKADFEIFVRVGKLSAGDFDL